MRSVGFKTRMTVPISGVIVVGLAVLIVFQIRDSVTYARREAFSKAEEMAHRYANQAGAQLNDAMLAARTVAQTFEGMKLAWVDDRSLLNSILSQVLRANTNFLATWTCWEANALDGKDTNFVNKAGNDAAGRFAPLWFRKGNDVALATLEGFNTPGPGDFYLAARQRGLEFVSEPRRAQIGGRDVFVSTVSVPVRYNGEVAGVAGIHVDMNELQRIIGRIKPYETGYAGLLSHAGTIVAHTYAEEIGSSIADKAGNTHILEVIRNGAVHTQLRASQRLASDVYEVYVPIAIGQARTPWALAVALPMNQIMAEAYRAARNATFIGGGILVAMLLVVIWLARSVTRPLAGLATGLDGAAQLVEQTANHMSQASTSLATGASEQAAALEETSSSLEEMSSMIKRNAGHAQNAKDLANQARSAAESGVADMHEMSRAMDEIKTASDNIAKINKTIDEIAFQTNILALNAAVEAARAGEAGLGFAVVADEVRKLAQGSAQAARETANKIEDSIRKSERGVQISAKVARGLEEILSRVRNVDQLVAEIASASAEQSHGIQQINTTAAHVDRITQNNALSAQDTAQAATELKANAQSLKNSVTELLAIVGGARRLEVAGPPAEPAVRAPRSAPVKRNGSGHVGLEKMAPAPFPDLEIPPADDSEGNFRTTLRA